MASLEGWVERWGEMAALEGYSRFFLDKRLGSVENMGRYLGVVVPGVKYTPC